MAVTEAFIKIDRCYAVDNQSDSLGADQHRRVLSIKDGVVFYESWGGGVGYQGGSLFRVKVRLEKFAVDVREEIPCSADIPAMPCMD